MKISRGKYDLTVTNYLRSDLKDGNGECPIYCRIDLNKTNEEFPTGISVNTNQWNGWMVVGNADLTDSLNLILKDLEVKISANFVLLQSKDRIISAKTIVEMVQGNVKSVTVLSVAWDLYKTKSGVREYSSLKHIEKYIEHLHDFLKANENESMFIDEINMPFMQRWVDYLFSAKQYKTSYVRAHVAFLKSLSKHAVIYNLIDKDQVIHYKAPIGKNKEIVYLNEKELMKLRKHVFASRTLQIVADLFVFQCYTGLSFYDLYRFNKTYLTRGPEGEDWIRYRRTKTTSVASLPLLLEARQILEKYYFQLPKYSNGSYNKYLKEVALVVGIEDKNISSHVGRKTFGTIALSRGASLEAVSKALGHATTEMTRKHYAVLLDSRITREIKLLSDGEKKKKSGPSKDRSSISNRTKKKQPPKNQSGTSDK